jgi:hypothetical protein
MPDKQVARPIRPHDATTMQLNRPLLREPVHDQQFVKWIFQGLNWPWKTSEALFIHLYRGAAETFIDQKSLVRLVPEKRSVKVKQERRLTFMQLPRGPGIEESTADTGFKPIFPFNPDLDIRKTNRSPKWLQGRNQEDILPAFAHHFY